MAPKKRLWKDPAAKRRIEVAEETLEIAFRLARTVPDYAKNAIQRTQLLDDRTLTGPADAKAATGKSTTTTHPVVVEVENQDTLDVATRLHGLGFRPLILIMASDMKPGGGWLTGASAQEEQLFLRTALSADLGPCSALGGRGSSSHPFDEKRQWRYPLDPHAVIHSPAVAVLRASEAKDYTLLKPKERFMASFVSVAALRNPATTSNATKFARSADAERTQAKIDAMLQLAMVQGYDSMVLSAFGCGVFRNPAPAVADLFRASIERHARLPGFPKRIVFAVLDRDAHRNGNFHTFHRALHGLKLTVGDKTDNKGAPSKDFLTTKETARACMKDAKWMNEQVTQPSVMTHLLVCFDTHITAHPHPTPPSHFSLGSDRQKLSEWTREEYVAYLDEIKAGLTPCHVLIDPEDYFGTHAAAAPAGPSAADVPSRCFIADC